ncbi:MAG: putative glycoside hydrolase family 15 protein [Actinomycetota bacterium]|nr:putative glycoside hydrolase family 15 protein [Actinomycetota bacterium]
MSSNVGSTNLATNRSRARLLLVIVVCALGAVALALALSGTLDRDNNSGRHARRSEALSAVTGGVALFNREAYAYSSKLSLAQEARRYAIIVLQAPFADLAARLHRYNPRVQIYLYQFIARAGADDPRGLAVCTSLPTAKAHSWLLRGLDGHPLGLGPGPGYGLDIGSPTFQQACAAHATALAKRFGFDGVFLDGVGALPDYEFGRPVTLPKYPTQGSWITAMTSFLQTMRGAAHLGGLKLIANIGGATGQEPWQSWSALLDGAEEESWTDGGLGLAQQVPSWTAKLQNVAWSEAHGKYALLHSFSSGEGANVYGLASMLLVAGGHSSYSTSNANYVGAEAWFPEYGTATRLGAPRGRYVMRSGVYQRSFTNGLVLVNPTLQAAVHVTLDGTYSGSGRSHVSAVSLPATSGLILLRG